MKKKAFVYALVLSFFLLSCGGSSGSGSKDNGNGLPPGSIAEQDPNDSNHRQTVSVPVTINGSISSSSDYDYFSFTASSAFTVTLSNFGSSNLDLALYDNTNTLKDSSFTSNSTETVKFWSSGIYYVIVFPNGSLSSSQNYTLTIQYQ